MAGRPKLQALSRTLSDPEIQASLWEWIADGISMKECAQRLGTTRPVLYDWINQEGEDERKASLARARATQALGLVEDATEALETADERNIKQIKEVASHKRWMAERLDRAQWGLQHGTSVTLNVGELHLALLRSHQSSTTQLGVPVPNLLPVNDVPILGGGDNESATQCVSGHVSPVGDVHIPNPEGTPKGDVSTPSFDPPGVKPAMVPLEQGHP